jgi:hypothetical protein
MRITVWIPAVVLAFCGCLAAEVLSKPGESATKPLTEVDADNADWVLSATNALDGRASVEIHLARREGQWTGAFALAPRWNQASHAVDSNEMVWADGRLKGKVTVSFRSDGWVPSGNPPTAQWALDTRREGNTLVGTFTGEVDGKPSGGSLTGEVMPCSRSLAGRRLRVRLVDPTRLSEIFWCTVENDKPLGGYLFRGAWDGPVDLSRVDLRGCALTGEVSAVASDGKDLGSFGIRACIIAGRVGGTFSRQGVAQGGVLAGTCVPLNPRSRPTILRMPR